MSSAPILIAGAGLAGLSAAAALAQAGRAVIVLDKGRGVGGRMATRRFAGARFDHGAQFFTARDPAFQDLVAGWQAAGAAALWSHGFPGADGAPAEDGHPRYRGAEGMTSVPKLLAAGLDVRTETRITAVRRGGPGWLLDLHGGETLGGAALLLTPPVPQALALLDAGPVALPPDLRAALESITYAPCLALLARLDGPSGVPAPGALQIGGEPIFWIGDNQQKGISPAPALTIHGGPAFSAAHWGADDAVVAALLLRAARPWLGAAVIGRQLQRWRYSLPLNPLPQRFRAAPAADGAPLLFAGDAFGGPRVEGAALSGLAAAAALLERL